jgi:hypothetical protein
MIMSSVTIRARNLDNPLFGNQILVDTLAQEFHTPSSEVQQPYFQIQPQPPLNRVHITVIWDRWNKLSHQERSEIILDAYEKCQGQGSAQSVSVAMGLTQQEADRLGFILEPA